MNACSGPIWAGCVPAPRPMNQRTTVPPFGPGPAAIGGGVMLTVDGDGSGVWVVAAVEGALLGLGEAVAPHALATIVTRLRIATVVRGPERIRCIAGLLLYAVDWSMGFLCRDRARWGVDVRRRSPVAGRLRAGASRRSTRAGSARWPGSPGAGRVALRRRPRSGGGPSRGPSPRSAGGRW